MSRQRYTPGALPPALTTRALLDELAVGDPDEMLSLGEREVPSRQVGEMVMSELRKLDKVAYIRFASVYRSFEDVEDFRDAIRDLDK